MSHAAVSEKVDHSNAAASEQLKEAKRVVRMQLVLPPRSAERLDLLKDLTESTSYAEVVRNALRVYEALVTEAREGNEVLIRYPAGEVEKLVLF